MFIMPQEGGRDKLRVFEKRADFLTVLPSKSFVNSVLDTRHRRRADAVPEMEPDAPPFLMIKLFQVLEDPSRAPFATFGTGFLIGKLFQLLEDLLMELFSKVFAKVFNPGNVFNPRERVPPKHLLELLVSSHVPERVVKPLACGTYPYPHELRIIDSWRFDVATIT
jgi:hypothetical protein